MNECCENCKFYDGECKRGLMPVIFESENDYDCYNYEYDMPISDEFKKGE